MYSDILTAQTGDEAAKEKVIAENMGLVRSVAWRFTGRGCEFDDLCQLGAIGLLKAVERFDVSVGNRFSTYAVPLIMGEIKRFLRDDGAVKVSRSLKELAFRYEKLKQSPQFGEKTIAEAAKLLGVEESELSLAISAVKSVSSVEALEDEGVKLSAQDDFCNSENRMLIADMLDKLSRDDRRLVILRYFRQKTQSETAKILNTSQVGISRREKKILKLMRGFAD